MDRGTLLLVLRHEWIAFASFLVPPSMQGSTRRMGVMTDVHRRFLQLLMTHGVLEEWDVQRLQKHCYKVHDREYRFPVPRLLCHRVIRN